MNTELFKRLEALAWKRSKPFCYLCYQEAPSGVCVRCGTDDLMRLVDGVGCEYGIDWIVEHLVKEKLDPITVEEMFEEGLSGCYPETVKIGWIEVDTLSAIKDLDPISWNMARDEWADQEEQEGNLMTFDGGCTYFLASDIEEFLDEAETSRPKESMELHIEEFP